VHLLKFCQSRRTAPINRAGDPRGKPFQRGNPGRPKGARNKRTILVEQIMARDLEAIARAVSDAARGGDMRAAALVLDRLAPIRRGRPVQFAIPAEIDANGVVGAFVSVVKAIAEGTITPEEGASVAQVLEARRKAIETLEIEA
jgi:hypothetical protein